MKIRQGFVSNSSSASYYIKINEPWEAFVAKAIDKCWYPFFEVNTLSERIDELVVTRTSSIELAEQSEEHWLRSTLNEARAQLEWLKEEKKFLDELNQLRRYTYTQRERIVKLALEVYGIKYSDEEDHVDVSYFTAMHNDYFESMPEPLIELILYYVFEERNKIELSVEHNG